MTAALVGGTVAGTLLMNGLQALALTKEQILRKLGPVVVFTIGDEKGAVLTQEVTLQNGQKSPPTAGIFISQKDAQSYLELVKKREPKLAQQYQVRPVSLAEIYQFKQANQGKPQSLSFEFVPTQQQVNSAVAILKQGGQKIEQFGATPLFVLAEKKGNEFGFLVLERNNQKGIPMFFEREQVQDFLDQLKKQPNFSSSIQIHVVPLEGVMSELQSTAKRDPKREEFLNQVEIVPSADAIQVLQRIAQQQQQNRPQAQPKK
jgi:nickel transport protein